ncbi:tetratricopeptide repeat protein [Leptotrichia hongkongensis]|uniref:tetratricopeptide repeat protein n=1 Tax=Leptotrichia hongkongensis TaxID=554406 RepID=UPI0035A92DAF
MDIINISVDRIGKIYLELSTIRNDFFSNLILEIIENYHFLPDLKRKMIKKDVLINNLIEKEELDETVMLSINEIYDNFINSKIEAKNKLIQLNSVENIYENNNQYLNFDNVDSNNLGIGFDAEKSDYNLDDADNFFEKKEYDKSFKIYKKFALEGNAYAQYQTALSYSEGYGVVENQEKAFEWLIKSADQDFTSAQNVIGYLYSEGSKDINIEVDYEKAFEWYMKTAKKEDSIGEYSIGIFYLEGFGVEQNFKEAYRWFKKSLNHGYKEAEEMLKELSERVSKETLKKIEERCSDFVWNNFKKFKYNDYKIVLEFGISDEKVYLTRDSTLFKNGKNGFAITNRGIYCRSMFESYNNYTSYKKLSRARHFYATAGEIYTSEGDKIAYLIGSDDDERDLEQLFSDIRDYLKDEEFIE